jgi:hypothetical protein
MAASVATVRARPRRQDGAAVPADERRRGQEAAHEVADVVDRGEQAGVGGRQADLGAHHRDDRGEDEPPDAHGGGQGGRPGGDREPQARSGLDRRRRHDPRC